MWDYSYVCRVLFLKILWSFCCWIEGIVLLWYVVSFRKLLEVWVFFFIKWLVFFPVLFMLF